MGKGPGLGSNPGSDTRQQMDRSLHLSEPQTKEHKLPSQVDRERVNRPDLGRSLRLTCSPSSVHLLSQMRSPVPPQQQPGSFLSLCPQGGNTEAPRCRSHTLVLPIEPAKQAVRQKEVGCSEWETDTQPLGPGPGRKLLPLGPAPAPTPAALATMMALSGLSNMGATCD